MEQTGTFKIKLLGMLTLMFYVFSMVFPNVFWGGHHVYFLPIIAQVFIWLAVVYFLFFYSLSKEKPLHESIFKSAANIDTWKGTVLFSALMGMLFYFLPIYHDTYGDAFGLYPNPDFIIRKLSPGVVGRIWSFDYSDLKLGTGTILSLVEWLSYNLEVSCQAVFRILDAFFGFLFVFFWLRIINYLVKDKGWKLLLLLIGSFAPFLEIFCGHNEVYGAIVVLMMAYFYLLVRFFESKSGSTLIALSAVFLLGPKFHATAWLLLPTTFLAILWWIASKKEDFLEVFTVKGMFRVVIVPLVFIGGSMYFAMTGLIGQRSFTKETILDVKFLPILSKEAAPLDRYNLFSPDHFFDYLNQIFLWSAAGLFLLIFLLLFLRKKINWKRPLILVLGLTLLIYMCFFFIMNPLFSMPNDWDLFSLPAIPFLILLAVIVRQLDGKLLSKQLTGTVMAFSIFSVSIFFVNANQSSLSDKLVSQGIREFNTYWIGSSSNILQGSILQPSLEMRQETLLMAIDEVRPQAVLGSDIEFSELLHNAGRYCFDNNRYKESLVYFNEANLYSGLFCKNYYYLLSSHFMIGEYNLALEYGDEVIICESPSPIKAFEMVIHTAIEAEDKVKAMEYCDEYLKRWPESTAYQKIRSALHEGKNPKELFARNATEIRKIQPNEALNNPELTALIELKNDNAATNDSLLLLIAANKDSAIFTDHFYHGTLLQKVGHYFFNQEKNFDATIVFYEESDFFLEDNCESSYYKLLSNFMKGNYLEANRFSDSLIACGYPNQQKAFKIAIHTAIEANAADDGLRHCEAYLSRWPNDPFITSVFKDIKSGKSIEELKKLFKQN